MPFSRSNSSEIPSTDLRWACRLRVSFAVALLGIPLLGIRHLRRSEPYTASLGFYTLYPQRMRNPRSCPVSQGKKLFSYNKHGLFFTAGCYLTNQRSVLSSFLSQFPGNHITATMTVPYCSRVSGSQPIILYRFLLENPGFVDFFIDLARLISPRLRGLPL